ncbi:MAG TPA: ectonucleotide pyrophosphatase/phosphodiesterase [Dokdonella sp.]|nr:alkaline phosphatase family protein [Dokdonella sp.]HNR91755.1 ectonucleotide pyrophosphatase/phosphodiesterase [Dokdonella sp.]
MHLPWSTRLLILPLLLLAACAPSGVRKSVAPPDPVILVSIDGMRADYLERGLTPTLSAIAANGARAEYMRPSFPSLTFPNHYTLVTGLRPDRNGIVANHFEDKRIPKSRFSPTNREAVQDARWWNQAVPLWTTAQRTGLRAGTMFWPGSEAPVHGTWPDYWAPFDASVTDEARVDTVLGWLDLPAERRPSLLTLYFDRVDTSGHDFGPDSAEVDEALRHVDDALRRLLRGLDARGLGGRINLIIVSDHGMTANSPEQVIYLDDIVEEQAVHVVTWGALAGVRPLREHRRDVEKALLAPHDHMSCHRRRAIPARLHYGRNERIPPIVCIAEIGWMITSHAAMARMKHFPLGRHGYDNEEPDMRAIFVARGPAFREGVVIPPFDNVDVYPLLAHLLGLKPEPNDGDPVSTRAALH